MENSETASTPEHDGEGYVLINTSDFDQFRVDSRIISSQGNPDLLAILKDLDVLKDLVVGDLLDDEILFRLSANIKKFIEEQGGIPTSLGVSLLDFSESGTLERDTERQEKNSRQIGWVLSSLIAIVLTWRVSSALNLRSDNFEYGVSMLFAGIMVYLSALFGKEFLFKRKILKIKKLFEKMPPEINAERVKRNFVVSDDHWNDMSPFLWVQASRFETISLSPMVDAAFDQNGDLQFPSAKNWRNWPPENS